MTRWPPKTPSPSYAPPSASCSRRSIRPGAHWPLRSAPLCCATTSTPPWASLRATGTTRRPREALVDALVRDAVAALGVIDGQTLPAGALGAADLLALVAGQDTQQGDDGVFRIVKGVAKDRTISTVDPEARHGHKSRNRRFDGYKTHLSIDPDSELIDEVAVTAANVPDRDAVDDLLEGLADEEDKPEIFGDSAYADGPTRKALGDAGFEVVAKVPPVRNATGLYTKDRFNVDLETQSVTCPAGQRVAINPTADGGGRASFKLFCKDCPLRRACTKSRAGRTIAIGRHEDLLQAARSQQATPEWQARYRDDRPKVERKISHFARRPWGGRNAQGAGTPTDQHRRRYPRRSAQPGPIGRLGSGPRR